jgi:hypothetical protein
MTGSRTTWWIPVPGTSAVVSCIFVSITCDKAVMCCSYTCTHNVSAWVCCGFQAEQYCSVCPSSIKWSWGPSGTLIRLQGSHELAWGTKGLSLRPRSIWTVRSRTQALSIYMSIYLSQSWSTEISPAPTQVVQPIS